MDKTPAHVGIIMDGNRRWAKIRGLSSIAGHNYGSKVIKEIVRECGSSGIKELSIFAFSTENWNRVHSETKAIFSLFERFLSSEISELNKANVIFNVIGSFNKDQNKINELVQHAEKLTKNNNGLKLNVAMNYGGKMDIVSAAKKIALDFKENNIRFSQIDEKLFHSNLLSKNVSNIDLLIRTSGEQRISNFLLWQLCYAEFYFTETLWPDFNKKEFKKAIDFYTKRDRRFGSTKVS